MYRTALTVAHAPMFLRKLYCCFTVGDSYSYVLGCSCENSTFLTPATGLYLFSIIVMIQPQHGIVFLVPSMVRCIYVNSQQESALDMYAICWCFATQHVPPFALNRTMMSQCMMYFTCHRSLGQSDPSNEPPPALYSSSSPCHANSRLQLLRLPAREDEPSNSSSAQQQPDDHDDMISVRVQQPLRSCDCKSQRYYCNLDSNERIH